MLRRVCGHAASALGLTVQGAELPFGAWPHSVATQVQGAADGPSAPVGPTKIPVLLGQGYLEPSDCFMGGIDDHLRERGWPV